MHYETRCGGLIKVLWHDGQSMCLFAKRLERGRFVWPTGLTTLIHSNECFAIERFKRADKLIGKLLITGELLRGSLLERTFWHRRSCPKYARGERHWVFVLMVTYTQRFSHICFELSDAR
jgi:hypothetical protein